MSLSVFAGPLDPVNFGTPSAITVRVGGQNGTVNATGIISGALVISANQSVLTLANHSQYLTIQNISLFEPSGNASGGTLTVSNLTLFLLATNSTQLLFATNSTQFLTAANQSNTLLTSNLSMLILVQNISNFLDLRYLQASNASQFLSSAVLAPVLNTSNISNFFDLRYLQATNASQFLSVQNDSQYVKVNNLTNLQVTNITVSNSILGYYDGECPANQFVINVTESGSLVCAQPVVASANVTSGEGVIVNTSNNVNLNLTYVDALYYNQSRADARFLQTANISNFLDNRYFQATNLSNFAAVNETIGNLSVYSIVNYFDGACPANQFVTNITTEGTFVCAQPVVASANVTSGEGVIINSTNNANLNLTYLNERYFNQTESNNTYLQVANVSNFFDLRYLQATNASQFLTASNLSDVLTTSNISNFFDLRYLQASNTSLTDLTLVGSLGVTTYNGLLFSGNELNVTNASISNIYNYFEACAGGQFATNISENGSLVCAAPATGSGAVNNTATEPVQLSGQDIRLNLSYWEAHYMNKSIYEPFFGVNNTAGTGITLSGQQININEGYFNLYFLNASNSSQFISQNGAGNITLLNVSGYVGRDLNLSNNSLTNVQKITFAANVSDKTITHNSTCVVISGPTSSLSIC